jgi:hypothetical protein
MADLTVQIEQYGVQAQRNWQSSYEGHFDKASVIADDEKMVGKGTTVRPDKGPIPDKTRAQSRSYVTGKSPT